MTRALSVEASIQSNMQDHMHAYAELIYLQPRGYPTIYGVVISGLQPYNPSWSEKIVDMGYVPGFEIGVGYQPFVRSEMVALTWMHLDATKDAATNVPIGLTVYPNGNTNYQTVAPIYDMGPGIFGIKSATGANHFAFDRASLQIDNISQKKRELFNKSLHSAFKLGLDVIRINQSLTSTYFNNVGFPATTLSYAVPADPGYKFIDKATSGYWGVGPSLGVDLAYGLHDTFQILSQSLISLTCGPVTSKDNFQGFSSLNPNVGPQSLSTPSQVTIVPGFETKLGLEYQNYRWQKYQFSIQAGYRLASYLNAIWMVRPATLVLPGTAAGPEVATANMNIRTPAYEKNNFTWNGPYLRASLKLW